MGDIGNPQKWIELEPIEIPLTIPEPEKVPA